VTDPGTGKQGLGFRGLGNYFLSHSRNLVVGPPESELRSASSSDTINFGLLNPGGHTQRRRRAYGYEANQELLIHNHVEEIITGGAHIIVPDLIILPVDRMGPGGAHIIVPGAP